MMLGLSVLSLFFSLKLAACYIWEQPRDPYLRYQNVPKLSETTKRFSSYFMEMPSGGSSLRTKRGPGTPQASDVVFVLDSSSSVGRRNFHHEVRAIHSIIKKSSDVNNYGAVVFSSDAFVAFNFTNRKTALHKIRHVPFVPGKTNIQKALMLAQEMFLDKRFNLSNKNAKKVLLITDGLSNVHQELTLYRSYQLKMLGAQIYVIATGRFMFGAPETVGLATTPNRHFFRLYNMKAFHRATRNIRFLPIRKAQLPPSFSEHTTV